MKAKPWIVAACALIIAMLVLELHAEIYSWTDASGKKHFSDKRPVNQPAEKMDLRVNTYEEVSFDIAPSVAPSEKVVMYSTVWCGYCKKARNYFRAKKIPFTDYDIEKNIAAKEAYNRLGARGVPVILVGQRRMNGFSEAGFQQIYRR